MAEELPFRSEAEEDWDFKKADTQYLTHGLHPYPARMVPQIARRLIDRYAPKSDHKILDPFCGSGGVLVEAVLAERKAYGTDINPLAILLAKVKTKPLKISILEEKREELLRKIAEEINAEKSVKLPEDAEFPHLLFWFKPHVAGELAVIAQCIREMDEAELVDYRRFFEVCFSKAVIKSSNIDAEDNPYFIRSMKGSKLRGHNPDVTGIFRSQVDSSVTRMKDFLHHCKNYIEPEIHLQNSGSLEGMLGDDEIQLVVTSPPYGEEKRTMAYTSFSKLSLYWLGYDPRELRENRGRGLGGVISEKAPPELPSATLENILIEVGEKDPKASREVAAFFRDYLEAIKELHRVLKRGGYACIVIGNRNVRGVPILNDKITVELGELVNLRREKIIHRNIPRKVLPRSDGRIELINRESIVILKNE